MNWILTLFFHAGRRTLPQDDRLRAGRYDESGTFSPWTLFIR